MTDSFPVELIESGSFNSRVKYSSSSIERLAFSLERSGQLTPIRVRKSPRDEGRYEVIDGHRRVMAARKLGWQSIRAEVVETTDEQTFCESLIENYEREELSDYEKALFFERMNKEFSKTYEEIGRVVGLSKQQVCSYLAMLRLFSQSEMTSNTALRSAIHQLSEHHARVLSRVQDPETRKDLVLMIVRRNLSVRELTNIVSHLKGWFASDTNGMGLEQDKINVIEIDKKSASDTSEIRRIINDEFKLSQKGDFEKFRNMHVLGDRLSAFFSLPPHEMYQGSEAMERDREWFYHVSSRSISKIRDVKIELLGETAVATLRVEYETLTSEKVIQRAVRGTVVLIRRNNEWKIFHEHWSEISSNPSADSFTFLKLPS